MANTWTWDKLNRNSARLNPNVRGDNSRYTPKFEMRGVIPYKGTKSCLITLAAYGVTQKTMHAVSILFEDVEILNEAPDSNKARYYFKVEYKKETYWVKKFDKYRNPIRQRCSCRDYYFTWAWDNYHIAHILYGPAPRPYQRKTSWMPPRNPNHIIGFCKHIHNAWAFLKLKGFTLN